MSIGKFKKDELRCIADELKLVVPDNAKVLDLRELIQESEIYKNDKETYQAIVDFVLEEINDRRNENENRLEIEKIKLSQLEHENENRLEIEKIKLSQLEKELEIAKLHNQSGKSLPLQNENHFITTKCNIESLIKSIKTLTIPVPLRAESFNLFFQSIEKAFKTKNVPDKLKPEILLNILGEKANNLMIYLREEDLSDYNKFKGVKSIGAKNEKCNGKDDVSLGVLKQRVHFKNDRYEVELPWTRDSVELSDNFNLEKRQLGSPMRKMQSDKVLYSEYCKVFRNYLDQGIIEKVTNPFISTNDPVLYFPHQVIIKNESLTTKQQIE
ncbi:DUF1758 domain-containing protein [Trichonephila clavipes]|nr:DUF1758 domain-containing protein [Trichonephila clavipes]